MIKLHNVWMKKYLYILLILLSCAGNSFAQETKYLNREDRQKKVTPVQNIFKEIEEAINSGNVSGISRYIGSQTYFSLSNGSSGYYSSNQAFYILENFFNVYQVKSFRFNNIQSGDNNPYATGVYIYEIKGKRDNAQVYLSLKLVGTSWKITQITIN
jgi:hypothetical protein